MSSYNRVILMGNVTRDPELKHLQGDKAVCTFGVAVNHSYKSASGERKEEVTFVDCDAWGKTAEMIAQYFTKGKPIMLEGRLRMDSWEAKDGGGKRTKLKLVVDSFAFVGSKGDGEPAAPASRPARAAQPAATYEPMQEEDIPF